MQVTLVQCSPRSHRTDENDEKVGNMMHSDRCLSTDQAYYVKILKWLCETVPRKRPEL
jgi:hypothetical protein